MERKKKNEYHAPETSVTKIILQNILGAGSIEFSQDNNSGTTVLRTGDATTDAFGKEEDQNYNTWEE